MPSTVLILGARGRFGLAATRAFAQAGWRVLAQHRPGAPTPQLQGVQWLACPLHDRQALLQDAAGADVVLHAVNPPYTQWEQQALPLLADAMALATGLGALLMLPGNVYNFGAAMPAVLREDTPQHGHTRKGKIRIAMEQRLRDAGEDGTLRSVVIRAGDFFGSGTGSWFDLALAKHLGQGKLTYPGVWEVPTAWAYLPDLATAFVRLARRALSEPGRFAPFDVFHFAGHSLTGADWAAVLTPVARAQGGLAAPAALRRGALPWGLFKALRWFVPLFRELVEMQFLWRTPHALANNNLVALIGPEPHTPLALAAQAALADLGKLAAPPPRLPQDFSRPAVPPVP